MTDPRKIARGKPCMVRLSGCDGGGETTVLAHYRLAGTCGMGIKPPHWQAAWCCAHCHDIIDGRVYIVGLSQEAIPRDTIRLAHAEGVIRTLYELDKMGEL